MRSTEELQNFIESAWIDESIFELRPDYRAVLIAIDGLIPGPSDDLSEQILVAAETYASTQIADTPIEELPHIAAWRSVYLEFGAKPQRTRNSVEALMRRIEDGLPRINRLTDIYNAMSITHQVPIGGEDLAGYVGAPHLIRSHGDEPFDTVDGGESIVEFAPVGEVVWCDDSGITCRRWNWRQCRRTQLSESTTAALFILDMLDPFTSEMIDQTVEDLINALKKSSPDAVYSIRHMSK